MRSVSGSIDAMENTRAPLTPPPPDDDPAEPGSVGDPGALTAKQEIFAQAWARTGNQAAAYRMAYNVAERTLPATVWASASRIAALPHVRRRFEELQRQAALETIIEVREALQWQLDIATADPNEIAYTAKRACRHCYGTDHAYQWRDSDEYIAACVAAMDKEQDPPSDEGGYGYNRAFEPVLTCPHCLGNGIAEVVVNDTQKLTGKARRLYKGMDYKNGEWVVTMHDQAKAWENVCRMLGAFNDKLDLRTPAERRGATKLPDGISEVEAGRAYLALIG